MADPLSCVNGRYIQINNLVVRFLWERRNRPLPSSDPFPHNPLPPSRPVQATGFPSLSRGPR